jgi:hypothetical protein
MQNHTTREIEAAANTQLTSATDAVAAAIQFIRDVADDHGTNRAKSPLELRFGAERKAAVVDDAITSVAENSMAEYVRQIARGEGPAERQKFSLGNQLTWNPGLALPQFLLQGRPLLLTDPEQVARWDRLAKQEARETAHGPMAQIFKAQRRPAPADVAAELEKLAEGKIVFRSAARPGWDKVIYYRAGEKGTAERLAEILRGNRELTEQQQAEVWRLEGWPEADIAAELARMRNVQRMHDESWWTPQPSLMERARQQAKSLLAFGRSKETARTPAKFGATKFEPAEIQPAKFESERAQRPHHEIQRSPERIARLPQSAPLMVEGLVVEPVSGKPARSLPRSVPDAPAIAAFQHADAHAGVRSDLGRPRTNGEEKMPVGLTRQDEPILRWLDAAMEDLHRYTQRPRSGVK